MSSFNTLEVYKDLIAKGMDASQAQIHVQSLLDSEERIKHSLMQWLREAKEDFASQKLISILGGLILLTGAASIGMLWKMSVDVELLKMNMSYLMSKQK